MKGFDNQVILLAYIISNIVGLMLLLIAWKLTHIARFLFLLLFAWASLQNWTTALQHPGYYLEYADYTFMPFYKNFILGWFSEHITIVVGCIASCQALIALSMILKGTFLKLGIIGAIIFLLAIAPLGIGSGFPFSLSSSWALLLILKKGTHFYLWERKSFNYEYSTRR